MKRTGFLLLVGLMVTITALAAPAPKYQPWLQGWDKPIDSTNNCKLEREGDVLTVVVPGYKDLPVDPSSLGHTLHLMRTVEGNFVLQVRVSGTFGQPDLKDRVPEVMAGLAIRLVFLARKLAMNCGCLVR